MLFEALGNSYFIVHTESKLTYRNNDVGYTRCLSKSTLVIAQACCELQTAWAINVSTLSCTEIVKSSIMQVSRKQNLGPNIEKHAQQSTKRSISRDTSKQIEIRKKMQIADSFMNMFRTKPCSHISCIQC